MQTVLIVAVALAVGVPVIVAALVNWNDIVKVRGAFHRGVRIGVDHGHGIVPAHERGHDPGRDHLHATARDGHRV